MNELTPMNRIESKIYMIRGQKVMLDADLAELYGVQTFNLNKAVKRNLGRFPIDFMFQLNRNEYQALRFQFGMLKRGGHSKYLPYAFTEQGVAMLSSVLRSERAILVNIAIMRAFVKLKRAVANHQELVQMVKELRRKVGQHDIEIGIIIKAIDKMVEIEKKPKRKVGFLANR